MITPEIINDRYREFDDSNLIDYRLDVNIHSIEFTFNVDKHPKFLKRIGHLYAYQVLEFLIKAIYKWIEYKIHNNKCVIVYYHYNKCIINLQSKSYTIYDIHTDIIQATGHLK